MSECTHDCSGCHSECGARTDPKSLLVAPHPMSQIRKVIGVCSGKGGVGKSLVTALLANALRKQGMQVGILDADITGPSIPKAFGLTQKAEGVDDGLFPVRSRTGIDIMSLNLLLENDTDPVVWRGPVMTGAVTQFWTDVIWGTKDVLLIDMPPGTGDIMLTIYQTLPLDGIVLVSTPQELVGMIVQKGLKMAKMMHIPVLGLVENMSYVICPDCEKPFSIFGESHVEELAQTYQIPTTAKLPISPKLATLVDKGQVETCQETWLDEMAKYVIALPTRSEKQ